MIQNLEKLAKTESNQPKTDQINQKLGTFGKDQIKLSQISQKLIKLTKNWSDEPKISQISQNRQSLKFLMI